MKNPQTDAYAAGLVDGEGCIGIAHSNGVYSIRVDVGMTVKASSLLRLLQAQYGGKIRLHRAKTDRWEAAEGWTVHGAEAAAFLLRLQPYLRLKAEQAQIALRVEEIRLNNPLTPTGRARWTEESLTRCAVLKRRMHELNQKGPEAETTGPGRFVARLVAGEWVTDQADLFSDLGWASFSGPWPPSGTTRNGCAYAHPISVPLINGTGSSSPPTLPTPPRHYGRNLSPSEHASVRPSLAAIAKELAD